MSGMPGREPAFTDLHQRVAGLNQDLEPVVRIRMHGRLGVPCPPREHSGHHGCDHLQQIGGVQRRPRNPPQVELVWCPNVHAVDRVTAPHHPRTHQQRVAAERRPEVGQCIRHDRGHVSAQETARLDVPAVARIARGTIRRIPEAVVVVVDRQYGPAAIEQRPNAPSSAKRRGDIGYQQLQRVHPRGGVGQVAECECLGQSRG
jgi:hypothetical protein